MSTIITFYNEKINPQVVELQKKVFNKFGLNINQIKPSNWVSHGQSVDDFLNTITDPNEIIVLFDIDCIPLDSKIVPTAIKWCSENIGIFSMAQKAMKLKNPIIHAAPAFMVFSKKTYDFLGRPTFNTNFRSDCGAEMTHAARNLGVEIRMLYPNHVEVPHSYFDGYLQFGYGTTYGNRIYHSFESRFNKDSYFIKKCEEILNG